MTVMEPEELLARLHRDARIPPADLVGQVDKGYGKLDYLGHAAVTDILLEHDPCWEWEPYAADDQGLPKVMCDSQGRPRALWIILTVHGHSRIGIGTCSPNAGEPYKELIGDALRNAAMRFGVGTSLWAKEEWSDEGVTDESRSGERPQGLRGKSSLDNAPRTGNSRTRKSEPVLPKDQALAKQAQDLGLDDQTRKDIIHAITKGRTASGKDLEPAEVIWVATALEDVAGGVVELRYEPDGTPRLGKPRTPTGDNPGPAGDDPF